MGLRMQITGALLTCFSIPTAVEAQQQHLNELRECPAAAISIEAVGLCLSDTRIAVRSISAFEQIYPPLVHGVVEGCSRRVSNVALVASCIFDVVKTAVEVDESRPRGTLLNDEPFNVLADKMLFKKYSQQLRAIELSR